MCAEDLQIEEIILRSETVSESLVWALCMMIQEFGLCQAEKEHSVFWWIQHEKMIMLVVYVGDIVIT